jgi:hypothetical protein
MRERGTRIELIGRIKTDLFCLRQNGKWERERERRRPKPMAADDDADWADFFAYGKKREEHPQGPVDGFN